MITASLAVQEALWQIADMLYSAFGAMFTPLSKWFKGKRGIKVVQVAIAAAGVENGYVCVCWMCRLRRVND